MSALRVETKTKVCTVIIQILLLGNKSYEFNYNYYSKVSVGLPA